jgi:glutaredoxin 3
MTGRLDGAGQDASADGVGDGVVLFVTRLCGYCHRAKALLESKGVAFEQIMVDADPEQRRRMQRLTGARTVPQIFIHGHHVGGCDQLYALERAGRLDALLGAPDASGG